MANLLQPTEAPYFLPPEEAAAYLERVEEAIERSVKKAALSLPLPRHFSLLDFRGNVFSSDILPEIAKIAFLDLVRQERLWLEERSSFGVATPFNMGTGFPSVASWLADLESAWKETEEKKQEAPLDEYVAEWKNRGGNKQENAALLTPCFGALTWRRQPFFKAHVGKAMRAFLPPQDPDDRLEWTKVIYRLSFGITEGYGAVFVKSALTVGCDSADYRARHGDPDVKPTETDETLRVHMWKARFSPQAGFEFGELDA